MPQTLIEIVQDILSAMDSDEVNSINDTTEAQQVATIVKRCYYDILSEIELPDEYRVFNLDASGDVTLPVVMTLPNTIENVEWVKYNKVSTTDVNQKFIQIPFYPKEEFLRVVQSYPSSDSTVESFTLDVENGTVDLLYLTDRSPEFYTTFDNRTLVFNAIDTDVDTTLQSSKTLCYGKLSPSFELDDSYVPFRDTKYESFLFNAAKATAFAELKQITNAKAEKAERRARIKTQPSKRAVEHDWPWYSQHTGYGRRI